MMPTIGGPHPGDYLFPVPVGTPEGHIDARILVHLYDDAGPLPEGVDGFEDFVLAVTHLEEVTPSVPTELERSVHGTSRWVIEDRD